MVALRSYDDQIVFHLMGGQSIPDRTQPECVQIKKGGIKGLISPWQIIDQKGATQDGVTFVDALRDPMEPGLQVRIYGRDGRHVRQVMRDLIASIHEKKTSELSWTTHESGRWWTNVRWFKTPPDPYIGAQNKYQDLTLLLRSDDGFWRSYDTVDSFGFTYESMIDTFNYTDATTLGVNWPQYYSGTGGGYCHATGSQAAWVDDPADPFTTNPREVVNGPFKDFSTTTDNQVVDVVLGSIPELSFPDTAWNDIWGRMGRNPDGTWNGDGIRARFGWGQVWISAFVNFVEVWSHVKWFLIPPLFGEKFTLVCGFEGDPRMFKVLRNGSDWFTYKESGTTSKLGSAWRGVGFGMHAGGSLITQATPASVRKVAAGDNSTVSQEGYLKLVNVGDQTMPLRFTCYGPGTFTMQNPGTQDSVVFGKLLPNQVMTLFATPGKNKIVNLTSTPAQQQELNLFQKALKDFISFATGNNVDPLLQQIESFFGILPPQGNPYTLLQGRFTKALPEKPSGSPAEVQHIKVSIDDGNANSRVVAAGTPLRRYPG